MGNSLLTEKFPFLLAHTLRACVLTSRQSLKFYTTPLLLLLKLISGLFLFSPTGIIFSRPQTMVVFIVHVLNTYNQPHLQLP